MIAIPTGGVQSLTLRAMGLATLAVIASDPDGNPLTYEWEIVSDPTTKAKFVDKGTNSTAFGVELGTAGTGQLIVVRCYVSDGVVTGSLRPFALFNITLLGFNNPPVVKIKGILGSASARLVTGGAMAPDAGESLDPDPTDGVSFQWFVDATKSGSYCAGGAPIGTGMNGPNPSVSIPEMSGNIEQDLRLEMEDGLHNVMTIVTAYLAPDSTPCSTGGGGGGTNIQPTVSAGLDQTVKFGDTVTLNGSFSDPDGDTPADITWTQLGGTGANVGLSPSNKVLKPTFTAPSTTTTLTFQLTATDGKGGSGNATTRVFVNSSGGGSGGGGGLETLPGCSGNNQPGQANAGLDQTVNAGDTVTIAGSGFDPDNTETVIGGVVARGVIYQWEVLDGKGFTIALQNANTNTVSFAAPQVTQDTTIVLGLSVKDPLGCGTRDQVNVTIKAVNVATFDFVAEPSSRTVGRSGLTTFTLKFTSKNGFSGPIALFTTNFAGGTMNLSPPTSVNLTANGTANVTATVNVSATANITTYSIEFTAQSGSTTKKATVTVTVDDLGEIDLEVATASALASPGGGTSFALTLKSLSGFTGPVTLTSNGLSVGTITFSPTSPVTLSANQTVPITANVTVNSSAALGSYPFKFTATSGTRSKEKSVSLSVEQIKALVFPASLDTGHTLFKNTFVGVAVVNQGGASNNIEVSGRDAAGGEKANVQLPSAIPAQGQNAFLTTDSFLSSAQGAVALIAQGKQGPIQGFFMAGDGNLERLDGIGGELQESGFLYFSLARHNATSATLLFLFNADQVSDPSVTLSLYDQNGSLKDQENVAIAASGTFAGTLDKIFGSGTAIDEGYVTVSASKSKKLKGFEFYARGQDFSSLTARTGMETERLLVPHIFVDGQGGTTELRLLNVGDNKAFVKIKAFDDKAQSLGTKDIEIEPKKLFVGDLKQLLNLNTSSLKEYEFITGILDLQITGPLVGIFPRKATVIGSVSFSGNKGQFMSSLPMLETGQTETVFLHVAQISQGQLKWFTGLAIYNPGTSAARVRVQAFDQNGNKTAEAEFDLPGGNRVVGLINEQRFFGSSFQQTKGHIRVSSVTSSSVPVAVPIIAFALFGDEASKFLAAIEGQKPLK